MNLITKEEFARATRIDKMPLPGLATLLMEILKLNQLNDTFQKAEHLQGSAFIDQILHILGVTLEFDEQELKNIPRNGAFIAIANHPYGGIEGLALLKILTLVRPDTKLMANFLLKKIPNLSDYLIAVNPFENEEYSSSFSGVKTTLSLLQNGTPVGIFPAGEVSSFKVQKQQVTDSVWHPIIGRIVEKANVPVVPIYFHGNNGLFFSLLNLVHPVLQTAKLPSELFNKQGHTIRIRIGKPVPVGTIPFHGNTIKLLDYLRAKTYALGKSFEVEKSLLYPKNIIKETRYPTGIINALPLTLITQEIKTLVGDKLCSEENYEVYISPISHIPHIIQEIGRLREITFREVGEGTGQATDLDENDSYYDHLFIWDTSTKMIVGAYRIGRGDAVFHSKGINGFYLSELFKIQEPLNPILQKSLELGRSWIRKDYQQKALPLFLLWKGILQFLMANPQYRYLIGAVSISNKFSKFSKSLIVQYIIKKHYDIELAKYVKPRKKFKAEPSGKDFDSLTEFYGSIKDLDDLISDIESTHQKMPVLLRQYLALNGRILCFNMDPKFSDSLDGFLLVDKENIPTGMLEKLGRNKIMLPLNT